MGIISPSAVIGGKNTLSIGIMPFHPAGWLELKNSDIEAYKKMKEETADFFIKIAEKYCLPGLTENIEVKDISTPATYINYLGSPTGSIYDMSPYVDNFGLKRLKMRTPVRNLYQPKFSHGVWPCLQAGLQAADMILGGGIMHGYARFRAEQ
jgi:phytoene dehydrogenase-like protein